LSVALAAVALVYFVFFCALTARENAVLTALKIVSGADESSECSHFETEWMRVVSIPIPGKSSVIMVSPIVVSLGGDAMQTLESIDNPGCPKKKLRRARRAAMTVRYIELEHWPWGAAEFMTLNNGAAVCAQHALEDFDKRFTCNTE
jgi:hypothetical protein